MTRAPTTHPPSDAPAAAAVHGAGAAVRGAGAAVRGAGAAVRGAGAAVRGVAGARLTALAVAAALLAVAAPAHAWRRPVPGAVARGFAYAPARPFAAGQHRGADFAASPGALVRAACSGRVAFAGRGVVTLRCGPWRVTHLPLATFTVRAGARVREGARLGTLAASSEHAGLHLGVRRAGDRFAYVDPLPLLGPEIPRVGPPGVARRAPPHNAAPAQPRDAAPAQPRDAAPAQPRDAAPAQPAVRTRPVATWPVWLGLALAFAGAAGGGFTLRVRRRRAGAARPRTANA